MPVRSNDMSRFKRGEKVVAVMRVVGPKDTLMKGFTYMVRGREKFRGEWWVRVALVGNDGESLVDVEDRFHQGCFVHKGEEVAEDDTDT